MRTSILSGFLFALALSFAVPCLSQESSQVSQAARLQKRDFVDSLLSLFGIEELIKFRDFYSREIKRLERERDLLRERAIRDAERFLAANPKSEHADKILIRLAHFYYQKASEQFEKDREAYDKQLEAYEEGLVAEPPGEEPKPDFSKAIENYQRIIKEFPASELYDDALYHLAVALDKSGRVEEARLLYERLVTDYPKSRYAPHAYIRLGEYYFNPPIKDLEKAIQYYKEVLKYRDTPRFDEALYKLGWSYYLLERYPEAISAFTLLVDDISHQPEWDPLKRYINPDLKQEAIEYMGVSFFEYGGLEMALDYMKAIGDRDYWADVLIKLGKVYKDDVEEYELAVKTYQAFLKLYPYHEKAPEVQRSIVKCARRLGDYEAVYLAQRQLFESYKPGSSWAEEIRKRMPDRADTVIAKAEQAAELALRENIGIMIASATQSNDLRLFQIAVSDCKRYLQYFPTDTNAYTVHWNMAFIMDAKLGWKEDAYFEYLKICNNYYQDRYRRLAARNAIVVAREAVEKEKAARADTTRKEATFAEMRQAARQEERLRQLRKIKPLELTVWEQRLIDAYNNFIKHFPDDKETAIALANAGALYFNKYHFSRALRYFNTLIERFPDSPEVINARYIVMESYFGKLDFPTAELVARELQESEAPPEVKAKARRRMAESIFLHAEMLAEEGKSVKAAAEYQRVVAEVPEVEFADLALFKAGVAFDSAKEFQRAVTAYTQLVESFPNSKYYLDALNNLALDYGELKEYRRAAQIYERIANSHPDSSKARDALYNASYYYVQAEDWDNAIRVNRLYIEKYPDAPDAKDLFFDMASYYLKLDQLENANEIYKAFAERYPNSPRSVEAYYRRGEYYMAQGRPEEAIREFDLAIAYNEKLKRSGLETNDYYAAEALFWKSEIQYREYEKIRFTLANFEEARRRKTELLKKLVAQYTRVATYGTVRLYQATFNVGKVYENYAETWLYQELPKLDETQRVVRQNQIFQVASDLFNRAFESYKNTLKVLRRLAENYKKAHPEIAEKPPSRVSVEDSTIRVANRWINLAGEKVSEMLFRMADLNYRSVENLLQAPLPEGLDELAALEYRNQVYKRALAPLVAKVLEAHVRNLEEADSLKLANLWVDRSRERIVEVLKILPLEYYNLIRESFETYLRYLREYVRIMRTGTEEETGAALDLAGTMLNLIDLGEAYAKTMITYFQETVEQLKRPEFGEQVRRQATAEFLEKLYYLALQFKSTADSCQAQRDYFERLLQKERKVAYEDAVYAFSDNYESLRGVAAYLCEVAYPLTQEEGADPLLGAKLTSLMVELNPARYVTELDLPVEELVISTDSTWRVALEAPEGWEEQGFNDSLWVSAVFWEKGEVGKPLGLDSLGVKAIGYPIQYDTLVVQKPVAKDTISQPDTTTVPPDTTSRDTLRVIYRLVPRRYPVLFFRKSFAINDIPLKADFLLQADDDVLVYFNGLKLFEEKSDALGWEVVHKMDVLDYLRSGGNLLAVRVTDTDTTGKGFRGLLRIRQIPRWRFVLEERKVAEEQQLRQREWEFYIFEKNRLPKTLLEGKK